MCSSDLPNLKSISLATEDDILALWTGLGFYRRAKNIYKTKEIIKKEYNKTKKTEPNRVHLNFKADTFSSSITKWYIQNGRKNLPWRKVITPYRIWISEIMLQQTQVKTVIPFYKKFIKKYPNLKSISLATEDDILALWTGLGFYRRAKNIYRKIGRASCRERV